VNGATEPNLSLLDDVRRWSLTIVGVSAVVLSVGSYAIDHDSPVFDALTAVIPMSVGLWIAAVGYRVVRRSDPPDRIWQLTRRTVLGATVACVGTVGIILLLGLSLVGSEAIWEALENAIELTTTFVGQLVLADVLIATVIGGGGGLLLGIYEDRMAQRTQELERANQRLDEFAGVVSHDLRNPLTVADLNLLLARQTGDEEHFEAVHRAHTRMEQIIDDVLTLSRNGDDVIEPVLTDLAQAAWDAWETTDARDGTLDVRVTGMATADPTRLRTLFENLFRNALDHGGPGTHIVVGNLGGGGFYVADDGPGIPATEREHVFDAGYTTSESGTGFGLAIVKRIAEAHGWTVSVTESGNTGIPADDTVSGGTDSGSTVSYGGGARFEFRR
jgi:signal transduction histidine kinase